MPQSKKTPVEVLISLRKTPDISAGEAHISQRLAFDLLSLQSEGYDGKQLLEVVTKKSLHEMTEPAHTNMQDMLLCFGAGTAILNTQTKTVEIHPRISHSSDPIDKETVLSFTQAKQIIQPLYFLQMYLDIISDHLATDQQPQDIFKRMKGIHTDIQNKTWEEIEKQAIKTLFSCPSLYILFPELQDSIISDKEKSFFITHSIVRDAKLRLILARNMMRIKQNLQHLPAIEVFEEEELLLKRKQEEMKRQHHEVKVIINYLQQYVPHMHATDMLTLQEFLREQDVSKASLQYEIERIVAHTYGISTVMLKDLKDKMKLEQEIKELEKRIQDPSLVGTPDQKIQTLHDTLQAKHTELKTRYTDPELDSHREDMHHIASLFEKDKTDKHPHGFINHVIDTIISYDKKIKEYDTQLHNLQEKEQSSSKKQTRIRLQEEAKYIDQISTVLDQSLIQFIIARYDEVTIAMQQRMQAMDEEREKQHVLNQTHLQDKQKAKKEFFLNPLEQQEMRDLQAISAFLRNRWITFDIRNRQHIVHADQIKNDILTLLYQSDEGLKIIIQHALGIPDADVLSSNDRKRIDTMLNMKGNYIKRKLLRDFFISRVWGGSHLVHTAPGADAGAVPVRVSLREHEWELFMQVCEDDIQEGIQSSQEARRLVYYLEGKGIQPHAKIKWLIYALILLKAGFFGQYAHPPLLEEHNTSSSQKQPLMKHIQ